MTLQWISYVQTIRWTVDYDLRATLISHDHPLSGWHVVLTGTASKGACWFALISYLCSKRFL